MGTSGGCSSSGDACFISSVLFLKDDAVSRSTVNAALEAVPGSSGPYVMFVASLESASLKILSLFSSIAPGSVCSILAVTMPVAAGFAAFALANYGIAQSS